MLAAIYLKVFYHLRRTSQEYIRDLIPYKWEGQVSGLKSLFI